MLIQQNQQNSLPLQSNKKYQSLGRVNAHEQQSKQFVKGRQSGDNFFFTHTSRQSLTTFYRGKSQQLSSLSNRQKRQEITDMYNQYSLFKYGNVLTGNRKSRNKNATLINAHNILAFTIERLKHDKHQFNPEIKKYTNGKQAIQQSQQMKGRLTQLKQGRNGLLKEIKRYVPEKDKK